MSNRISSLSNGYTEGMLSVYPEALDDFDSLYKATNNAIVPLKQTLTFNGNRVIVEDTSLFPNSGIIRLGGELGKSSNSELIYYGSKTKNTFENLSRGFAGTRQSLWRASDSFVSNSVVAEHHNAVKDALINMQINCGLKDFPDSNSLNGILKAQEVRFLAPKPSFRAFPLKGTPNLTVRFQNLSSGHVVRHLWDFGDGGTSLEKNPTHTYLAEGIYTVKLNVVTASGAQGVSTKTGYIRIDADESEPFFYLESYLNPYSQEYANANGLQPKEFKFVCQTDGDIVQRNWIFGDGTSFTQEDPNIHDVSHIYAKKGEYTVSELIQFANGRLKRVELPEPIIVM